MSTRVHELAKELGLKSQELLSRIVGQFAGRAVYAPDSGREEQLATLDQVGRDGTRRCEARQVVRPSAGHLRARRRAIANGPRIALFAPFIDRHLRRGLRPSQRELFVAILIA